MISHRDHLTNNFLYVSMIYNSTFGSHKILMNSPPIAFAKAGVSPLTGFVSCFPELWLLPYPALSLNEFSIDFAVSGASARSDPSLTYRVLRSFSLWPGTLSGLWFLVAWSQWPHYDRLCPHVHSVGRWRGLRGPIPIVSVATRTVLRGHFDHELVST